MQTFSTIADVHNWLECHGLPLNEYGHGQAKSVKDLFHEIVSGEAVLEDDPPMRIVEVVGMIIERAGRILVEYEQLFHDGRRRIRNIVPGEKMKRGEAPLDAARRWLVEEMAEYADSLVICGETYTKFEKTLISPSYPGLKTRYILHHFRVRGDGLPEETFRTAENAVDDMVKEHTWVWSARHPL